MDHKVRRADRNDIGRILELLRQVDMVHNGIRPDLFKPFTAKYSMMELEALLDDDGRPVFVYDDGEVLGHVFCMISEVRDHKLLQDVRTLHFPFTGIWE